MSGIFVTAAVARHLGPEPYGVVTVSIAIASIFAAGAGMGSDHINLAALSSRSGLAARAFLASALTARVLWGALILVAYGICILVANPVTASESVLAGLLIPAASFSIMTAYVQGTGTFLTFARLGLASTVVGAAFKLIGIAVHAPAAYFVIAIILENGVLIALSMFWAARPPSAWRRVTVDAKAARDYFKVCAPMAISAAMVTAYLRIEVVVIAAVLGPMQAGLWSAISMMIVPWNMLVGTLLTVTNKQVSQQSAATGSLDGQVFCRCVRQATLYGGAFALAMVIALPWLLPLIFGPQFEGSILPAQVAVWSVIPLSWGAIHDVWIAHTKRTNIVLTKVCIGLPVGALFAYFGATTYGLLGISIASLVSYLIMTLPVNIFVDRRFFGIQLQAIGLRYGERD